MTIPPLIDMGVFTKDGKVVASMYDKFVQINRFIEVIDHTISQRNDDFLRIVDFGCGKSYLTFLLYYYFVEIKKINVEVIGLDLKEEVIANCNISARKYGYNNLSFQLGDISDFTSENPIDMVVTLHACDTATDYALYNAVNWNAEMIFSVPCCHKELAGQMTSENMGILTRYGIVKQRIASALTDSIRANLLTYCGYNTQLIEFVDWENTPKNTLIRGEKRDISPTVKENALKEVKAACKEFSVQPTLVKLLNL